MGQFEVEMNKALKNLAKIVIPNDRDLKDGNVCANKIIKLLQTKSKCKIGRVLIAGSIGKKTTINGSDIDCVLFINGELPPFNDVLDDFENILTMVDGFNIRDIRTTKYSIQFKALNFEFDILPASNFTENIQADGDTLIDIQYEKVIQRIQQDPKKNSYMYSSSLSDSTKRFMKRQDGFVNEMVRLGKHWYKTLLFPDYVSGAKNFIELIAVKAACQEREYENRSYLRSFKRFITYMENFNNLDIHFEEDDDKILVKNRPRIMDPVNPYNNLANNWDRKSIQLLESYASETNRRLQSLKNSRATWLDELFKEQPACRIDMEEIVEDQDDWLLGTVNYSSLPDLIVRNELFHTDYALIRFVQSFKDILQRSVCALRASGYDENQIQEGVEELISEQYKTEILWSSADENEHEDYDVTFTIPISGEHAIRASYRL